MEKTKSLVIAWNDLLINLVSYTEHECKIDVEVFKKYAHRYDNSTHNPRPVVPPLLAFQA